MKCEIMGNEDFIFIFIIALLCWILNRVMQKKKKKKSWWITKAKKLLKLSWIVKNKKIKWVKAKTNKQ